MANMYVNVTESCIFSDHIVAPNKGSLAGLETLIKDSGQSATTSVQIMH